MPKILTIVRKPFPTVDTSTFRLKKLQSIRANISFRAVIREDLKAGGSVRRSFKARISPTGVIVDLTA